MYDDIISEAATRWGIPSAWIQAVIQVESAWNPAAYNSSDPGGSYGLMQIGAALAQSYGITDLTSLFDPWENIDAGARYLSELQARYGSDFRSVYSAYNSGSPTAWQTSSTVADHVQSALTALQGYLSTGVQTVGTWGPVVVLLVVYFFWRRLPR